MKTHGATLAILRPPKTVPSASRCHLGIWRGVGVVRALLTGVVVVPRGGNPLSQRRIVKVCWSSIKQNLAGYGFRAAPTVAMQKNSHDEEQRDSGRRRSYLDVDVG